MSGSIFDAVCAGSPSALQKKEKQAVEFLKND